jgi:hypothetical protein
VATALLASVLACGAIGAAQAQTIIYVSNVTQLQSAVATANSAGGGRTILLADGTYTLPDTLYINAPNVTIAGQSADREMVILQGDSMSSTARVGTLIRVAGSNFRLSDITLQKSKYHLLQIAGETNADSPVVRNCIMRDSYQQMLKVSVDVNNTSVASDNGLVENCLFEYSAGIGPQYYIGGIDAHGATNWTVRNNTFRSIASPSGAVAEFAVHFWNNSANNLVEGNVIINCDRGIGFGMDARPNSGGVIRNNMIYHSANSAPYADTAIALIESPSAQVYNNTVYMENNFPWAIEYRFPSTSGVVIANNLTNRPVLARDGASGSVSFNVVDAVRSWFADASTGNLRLASSVSSVVDKGQMISGLTNDIDGEARPQGSAVDIGADEFSIVATPRPPTNVTAN